MTAAIYLAEVAVRIALNTAYYGAKGIWWATKRAIWGRPVTMEERQQQILERQEQMLLVQDRHQQTTSEGQAEMIQAMQLQLERQEEMINRLREAAVATTTEKIKISTA